MPLRTPSAWPRLNRWPVSVVCRSTRFPASLVKAFAHSSEPWRMPFLLMSPRLPFFPLPRNLSDHVIRPGGVQPKHLNGMSAANLHLQASADRRELQMFRPGSDRRDDAQTDLGNVRAIPGGFHGRDCARYDGRVAAVKLRSL